MKKRISSIVDLSAGQIQALSPSASSLIKGGTDATGVGKHVPRPVFIDLKEEDLL
ncbi:MAG: hypothetical protein AAGM67_17750 [Bacteroidota bacterium]